jgi:hypothetical protein
MMANKKRITVNARLGYVAKSPSRKEIFDAAAKVAVDIIGFYRTGSRVFSNRRGQSFFVTS